MVFSCDPISVIGMQRIISVGEIALLLSPLTREFSPQQLFHQRQKVPATRSKRAYVVGSDRGIRACVISLPRPTVFLHPSLDRYGRFEKGVDTCGKHLV